MIYSANEPELVSSVSKSMGVSNMSSGALSKELGVVICSPLVVLVLVVYLDRHDALSREIWTVSQHVMNSRGFNREDVISS